jgi:hypothetical protein
VDNEPTQQSAVFFGQLLPVGEQVVLLGFGNLFVSSHNVLDLVNRKNLNGLPQSPPKRGKGIQEHGIAATFFYLKPNLICRILAPTAIKVVGAKLQKPCGMRKAFEDLLARCRIKG